jgi:[protein-PII] uridylyltransferase
VEVQALDRIGLLHDLFHAINHYGLNTVHARICTEKGVAMDTLYITTADGSKVHDLDLLQQLSDAFAILIGRPETST